MDDHRARFEEIYEQYSGLILAYAARRTSDPQDAADIVAETFVVAWRRILEVPSGDQARPWLYGVARLILANYHRSHRRRQSLDERLAAEIADVIDLATLEPELQPTDAAAAFAQLNESDRELLTLVGWDGLERDEIATLLGCTRATVRLRLHRARRRLRSLLETGSVKRAGNAGHGPDRWVHTLPEQEDM